MKYSLWIKGREHTLAQDGKDGSVWIMDGAAFSVQALEVAPGAYSVLIGGRSFLARVSDGDSASQQPGGAAHLQVEIDGVPIAVSIGDPRRRTAGGSGSLLAGAQRVAAPIPGKVVRVLVAERQRVETGEGLAILEAMKMQNEIRSPKSGVVQSLRMRAGQAVNAGDILVTIE